jgi:hypothetical protein
MMETRYPDNFYVCPKALWLDIGYFKDWFLKEAVC